jgi:small conductance mechanosensitive channel
MQAASGWVDQIIAVVVDLGFKVVGALILWVVGRMLISLAQRALSGRMVSKAVDPTLRKYVDSAANILLNLVLVIAILGVFGVETTTFAAVLAAAGVAIGMAWSGLLANFASGAFLMVLRPFKVGDFVKAGDIVGTVVEVGLFVTAIDTMDNVRTFVGNNKVFSGTIQNFSANPTRRVELTAQLAHSVDPADAVQRLRAALAQIPNVSTDPGPDVEILTFNLAGPVLAVRPHCHNDHYWQVYFDTNRVITEVFGSAGYPVPENHYRIEGTARAGAAAK